MDHRTLRERVFDHLKDDIVRGRRLPGEELSEEKLAVDYGVSRGTVREVLRSLQQLRLVGDGARRILRVHRADPREVAEIFNVRAALEGMAVCNIVHSPRRQELVRELRSFLPPEELGADFRAHVDRDLGFHLRLCELGGNAVLLELWRSLEDRMRMVFFASGASRPASIMTRGHHEPILSSMERGDAQAAQETVRRHMRDAAQLWAPGVDVFC